MLLNRVHDGLPKKPYVRPRAGLNRAHAGSASDPHRSYYQSCVGHRICQGPGR